MCARLLLFLAFVYGLTTSGCSRKATGGVTKAQAGKEQYYFDPAPFREVFPEPPPIPDSLPADEPTTPSVADKPLTFPPDQSKQARIWLDSLAKHNDRLKYAKGFRLLVYSGTDRAAAMKTKETLYRHGGGIEVYVGYSQPMFKVKAGDFLNRLQAESARRRLKRYFSELLIVPDEVNLR